MSGRTTAETECTCPFRWTTHYRSCPLYPATEAGITEQAAAEAAYPNHAPSTALANYRAGHEVWDTNGDAW